MKTLHVTFTDEEYEALKFAKERNGKNWHDFILTLVPEDLLEKQPSEGF